MKNKSLKITTKAERDKTAKDIARRVNDFSKNALSRDRQFAKRSSSGLK